jgi:peptidoglycan/LPS O-acetylase OafA/YrhL
VVGTQGLHKRQECAPNQHGTTAAPALHTPPPPTAPAAGASNTGPQTAFRRDINGLRAWAVVVVVLYHFGVSGFAGGFIGVDLFFVISGFLMTGIAIRALEGGRFSLAGFYVARARRIVPALAMLCAVLLLAGAFLLVPTDYLPLARHALSSLGFWSNQQYAAEAGYFDAASHDKWLLHTWSLSVEWQFYLLLPLLVAAVWRLNPGRATQRAVLGLVALASLLASIHISAVDPSKAFFGLGTRAWELLAGGLLATGTPRLPAAWRRTVLNLGLLLIGVSLALCRPQGWPGAMAALPVLAAVLVLVSNGHSPLTHHPLAQWLGDRSYSIYLWHWPLFVALSYLGPGAGTPALAAALLMTLLLSHWSHCWVEQPARRRLHGLPLVPAASLLLGGTLVLGLAAWSVAARGGWPGRFPVAVEAAADEAAGINPRRESCHARSGAASPGCVYGGSRVALVAIGDSHLDALMPGLAAANPDPAQGVLEWSYSGCPPLAELRPTDAKRARMASAWDCAAFVQWAGNSLRALPTEVPVLLAARYATAVAGTNEAGPGAGSADWEFGADEGASPAERGAAMGRRLVTMACELARERRVILLRPIPEIGIDVPRQLARRLALGLSDEISVPVADYQARNAWVWQAQDEAKLRCGVELLDPTSLLCDTRQCFGSYGSVPLYHDDDHLGKQGLARLRPLFEQVWSLAMAPTTPDRVPKSATPLPLTR